MLKNKYQLKNIKKVHITFFKNSTLYTKTVLKLNKIKNYPLTLKILKV